MCAHSAKSGFHLEKLVWGGSYEASLEFFALTTPTLANTPTFHIHNLLEVVHSMLTIAVFCIGEGGVESPTIGGLDVRVVPLPSSPLSGLVDLLSTTVWVAMAQLSRQ